MHCNQCEMLSIDGVVCHEYGCPNTHARWDVEEREFVPQYECRECGCMADVGETCCEGEEL
jgi:hypothetical protein